MMMWPVSHWFPWASLAPPIRREKLFPGFLRNYSMVGGIVIVLIPPKYGLSR